MTTTNLIDVGKPTSVDVTWSRERDAEGRPTGATVVLHYGAGDNVLNDVLRPVHQLIDAATPSRVTVKALEARS